MNLGYFATGREVRRLDRPVAATGAGLLALSLALALGGPSQIQSQEIRLVCPPLTQGLFVAHRLVLFCILILLS